MSIGNLADDLLGGCASFRGTAQMKGLMCLSILTLYLTTLCSCGSGDRSTVEKSYALLLEAEETSNPDLARRVMDEKYIYVTALRTLVSRRLTEKYGVGSDVFRDAETYERLWALEKSQLQEQMRNLDEKEFKSLLDPVFDELWVLVSKYAGVDEVLDQVVTQDKAVLTVKT